MSTSIRLATSLLLCVFALPVVAQTQAPTSPCADAAHRGFDFWLGKWNVTNADGPVGHNEIIAVQGDCAVLEHWVGVKGDSGRSLSAYDPSTGLWQQFFVGSSGLVLHLSGKATAHGMDLSGEIVSPDGKKRFKQHVTWTANADGSVHQLWQSSADGSSWTTAFDATYRHP